MQESKKGSVMMVDEQGGCKYYRRYSGPLRAGQTVIRIEVVQTTEYLDDEQAEVLGSQVEAFISTLRRGPETTLPDDVLAARLLGQTTEDAFNRLLKVRDDYAYWMLQAWIAEAQYLLERLPALHVKRPMVASVARRLQGWSNALAFDQDLEPKHRQEMDWGHMALHARRQAELVKRTSVDNGSPKSVRGRGQLQPLFARLRRLIKTDKRLYLVGCEDDIDLQESCRQAIGPVVEWLACKPNDAYQTSVRLQLTKNPSIAGVLLMPGIGHDLARDLMDFCLQAGLACITVARPDGEALREALCVLEEDPKIAPVI